ncbi:uncharacterized protein TRIADDRAFT_62189 [Trichoplax adhaerens]|uniref:Uncharacterized protein n=1 Tax=Trichoplax adhaerens TaxID=10228 RepID=B3SD33_TRIAD|nr:hypothetical protein TRIADDRAFT_62189 [Trichoplax adhaerens]EDV19370.1 hypothetical protein TRIADDRAFT_62189 [Trichoplax adhaerens]|eukprot:XP_002118145.1 hypothetical protein TRIADDRAFT_62189 [Trichoplax adhaerens]
MSYNNFTSISFGLLENLATMTDLSLAENRLALLFHNTFHDLNNLEEIYLQNNEIEVIEDGAFHNLQKLSILKLSRNIIAEISLPFWSLPNLRKLLMSSNTALLGELLFAMLIRVLTAKFGNFDSVHS